MHVVGLHKALNTIIFILQPHIVSFHSFVNMAVSVINRPSLQYMGSKLWPVPEQLLVDKDGTWFLKISPIHHGLVNFICDGLEIMQPASLAQSPGLEKLKDLRNKKAGPSSAADNLFDEPEVHVKKRTRKASGTTEDVVTLSVKGVDVQCLSPKTRQTEDLCVIIEPLALQAVFEAIRAEPGLVDRRSYKATGKFSKRKLEE
jgi:hypothetical protein